MIATGHTSVGVLVGLVAFQLLPDSLPLAAACLISGAAGLGSHYAMDMVPHGHYDYEAKKPSSRSKIILSIDIFAPIAAFLILFITLHGLTLGWWFVTFAIVGAQAPDILDTFLRTSLSPARLSDSPLIAKETAFHIATHWHNPTDPTKATPQGGRKLGWFDLWQVIVAIVAVIGVIILP